MLTKKTIFLFDSCGGALSLICLGFILPIFEQYIGMPLQVLYLLAAGAALCMLYSFFCYKFIDHSNPNYLRIIISANISYCLLTGTLLIYNFSSMTRIGAAYFILEILIILGLTNYERRFL